MAHSSPSAAEPAEFAYAPGELVAGKYQLEELLGQGGMGAVFRARNTVIDMPVAIKLIRADLNKEQLSGRLLQEARAAAKLAHPAIVRVFDVGQTERGDPFIVMELLSGESLASIMEREGRLTSTRAVQLLLPIADALSAAHAKGFVHRDVKPDNVFVVVDDEQLQPKLVDFGIVKLEQHDKNSQLTQVGTVLGSPDYMSPEQARGLDNIDLRSDVWSFAVMLYEAVAGQTPFSSTNYNALLRMIVEDEPASLRGLYAADAELSGIIAQAMSKDPAQRFQSMNLLGRALAQWLVSQGVSEDVCGVSLEAKWLSRAPDPQARAAGRGSRSSSPDSWPAPPSGVRAVRSSDAAMAPTVQVARDAGTPVSVAPVTRTIPPRARRLFLVIAGAAIVAAGVLSWLGLSYDRGARRPPILTSGAEPTAAPAAAEPPAEKRSVPAPTSVASVVEPAAPRASAARQSTTTSTRAPATKLKARPSEPAAKAPTAAKPAATTTDLISPY